MALPRLGGAGVGLPNVGLASNFTAIGSPPFTDGYYTGLSNAMTLAAGETWTVPAGTWWIARGPCTFIQFLDPITGRMKNFVGDVGCPIVVESDGSNWRLANLTGCAVGAVITAIGTVSAATTGIGSTATGLTVTVSSGASTWVPIIGGALPTAFATSTGVTTAGAGYNFVPVVVIDAPPPGGLQATAIVTSLSSGTIPVAAVQVLNQGAGYLTAPNLTFIPDPREANATTPGPTINAVVVATITATGVLTGLYPSNHGTALTGVPTLSFSTGTGAATVVMNFTITTPPVFTSTTAQGAGYPAGTTLVSTGNLVAAQASPAMVNPLHANGITFPRPARITANVVGGVITTTGSVIEDPGLGIQLVPTMGIIGTNTTGAAVAILGTPTVGGISDTSYVQQF